MKKIKVHLLSHSPLRNAIIGARTCYSSFDRDDYKDERNIGENNEKLLRRLIALGHESVIEHVVYTFRIVGSSRGFLQQLVRHRIASYSVQSTRYTLKKLISGAVINPEEFCVIPEEFTEKEREALLGMLLELKKAIKQFPNDVAKYLLPESFRTELVWTINARSLRNFLKLRLHPKAHFEIRHVANLVVKALPKTHLILFEDLLEGKNE